MEKSLITSAIILAVCFSGTAGFCDTKKGEKIDGKNAFEKHCTECHPNGGNTVNAKKPLNSKALRANGITSAKGIIAKMRNPGQGMTRFDEKTIPDNEAKAIADYILKTFK